jgi:shikimate dehydrogenase
MNTTTSTIGLFPHVEGRLDLDLDTLRPGLVVADVIPNPPRTQLIRDAEARDCIVLDGLGMLVSQGANISSSTRRLGEDFSLSAGPRK